MTLMILALTFTLYYITWMFFGCLRRYDLEIVAYFILTLNKLLTAYAFTLYSDLYIIFMRNIYYTIKLYTLLVVIIGSLGKRYSNELSCRMLHRLETSHLSTFSPKQPISEFEIFFHMKPHHYDRIPSLMSIW